MKPSKAGQISQFVQARITRLSHINNESRLAATLAKLRRGVGKEPGSLPELWEVTLDGMPESLQGNDEQPSFGERAAHTALTLFALHQQGKKEKWMSESGATLGGAMREMIRRNSERETAITRRFLAAVTADSYEELVWHLRGLVQLLRAEDIKLDYPLLAKELFDFQYPIRRDRIRLQWGRQFYWQPPQERSDNGSNDQK
ncbi:type I-E CRISPR-associated protein Cse2/CasB [Paenibacillus ginsengihumi]|uniref:type I-E CRISPR-associated protein Cse2/CasB n=1 Tax=Paenibacillus ginsengihumi TaxID=431596 RepID=UPI000378B096|nr:type I-E CRISPR-associated protein Cse2/CasB [Paenibacillus ginsengihumi]